MVLYFFLRNVSQFYRTTIPVLKTNFEPPHTEIPLVYKISSCNVVEIADKEKISACNVKKSACKDNVSYNEEVSEYHVKESARNIEVSPCNVKVLSYNVELLSYYENYLHKVVEAFHRSVCFEVM